VFPKRVLKKRLSDGQTSSSKLSAVGAYTVRWNQLIHGTLGPSRTDIAIGYSESGISQGFVLVQVGWQGFKP